MKSLVQYLIHFVGRWTGLSQLSVGVIGWISNKPSWQKRYPWAERRFHVSHGPSVPKLFWLSYLSMITRTTWSRTVVKWPYEECSFAWCTGLRFARYPSRPGRSFTTNQHITLLTAVRSKQTGINLIATEESLTNRSTRSLPFRRRDFLDQRGTSKPQQWISTSPTNAEKRHCHSEFTHLHESPCPNKLCPTSLPSGQALISIYDSYAQIRTSLTNIIKWTT